MTAPAALRRPAPVAVPALGVGWVVAMAVAAAGGALMAVAVPPWPVLAATLGAVLRGRRFLAVVGIGLAASGLAAASWAGLEPPARHPVAGWATLVSDPRPAGAGIRVDVRLHDGSRHRAWAYGPAAYRLAPRLSGERVLLQGRLRPLQDQPGWAAARHLAGALDVHEVERWSGGDPLARTANRLRRVLARGAEDLGLRERSLLAGLTVGDDREIPAATQADFRAAGLTHLLAVSGQNVAFVLALAGPLAGRRGLRSRLVVLAAVLVLFGTVTRWEPSVLRASVMAAVALGGTAGGRSVRGLRPLALTVAVLLLVDPLLVHSVGFLLSVGASAGIAVIARPLAARLPGPRVVVEPLAVTVAAQVGVAPVVLAVFGWLPVASLPANLLAGPAAGPAMSWGLVAGLLAGVVGGPVAWVLHLPTAVLVGWIAGVARAAAAVPGEATAPVVVAGLLAGLLAITVPSIRAPALACSAGLVLIAPFALAPDPAAGLEVARGARLWRGGGGSVVVVDGGDPVDVTAALIRHRVTRLDIAVASGSRDRSTLDVVSERVTIGTVVAGDGPGNEPGREIVDPGTGWSAIVGGWRVEARRDGARVTAEVTAEAAPSSALPSPGDGFP